MQLLLRRRSAATAQWVMLIIIISISIIQNLTLINNYGPTNTPDNNKTSGVMC